MGGAEEDDARVVCLNFLMDLGKSLDSSWVAVGILWITTFTTSTAFWRPVADGRMVRIVLCSCCTDFSRASEVVMLAAMRYIGCLAANRTSATKGLGSDLLRWSWSVRWVNSGQMAVPSLRIRMVLSLFLATAGLLVVLVGAFGALLTVTVVQDRWDTSGGAGSGRGSPGGGLGGAVGVGC